LTEIFRGGLGSRDGDRRVAFGRRDVDRDRDRLDDEEFRRSLRGDVRRFGDGSSFRRLAGDFPRRFGDSSFLCRFEEMLTVILRPLSVTARLSSTSSSLCDESLRRL
jgi:hypothetical protein